MKLMKEFNKVIMQYKNLFGLFGDKIHIIKLDEDKERGIACDIEFNALISDPNLVHVYTSTDRNAYIAFHMSYDEDKCDINPVYENAVKVLLSEACDDIEKIIDLMISDSDEKLPVIPPAMLISDSSGEVTNCDLVHIGKATFSLRGGSVHSSDECLCPFMFDLLRPISPGKWIADISLTKDALKLAERKPSDIGRFNRQFREDFYDLLDWFHNVYYCIQDKKGDKGYNGENVSIINGAICFDRNNYY